MKIFHSSKGIEVRVKPVSQFKIDTLKTSKKVVNPPLYEMTIVGGGSQSVPLDAEIAKNQNREDEWEAYLTEMSRNEREYAEKFMELLFWDGVDIEVPGIDSAWQIESQYFGIEIPDHPIKRKIFYIYNEILGSPEELGELIACILESGQVQEEVIQQLRSSFRSAVQRQADRTVPEVKELLESEPNLQHS